VAPAPEPSARPGPGVGAGADNLPRAAQADPRGAPPAFATPAKDSTRPLCAGAGDTGGRGRAPASGSKGGGLRLPPRASAAARGGAQGCSMRPSGTVSGEHVSLKEPLGGSGAAGSSATMDKKRKAPGVEPLAGGVRVPLQRTPCPPRLPYPSRTAPATQAPCLHVQLAGTIVAWFLCLQPLESRLTPQLSLPSVRMWRVACVCAVWHDLGAADADGLCKCGAGCVPLVRCPIPSSPGPHTACALCSPPCPPLLSLPPGPPGHRHPPPPHPLSSPNPFGSCAHIG
jgi:hypothetical protein